MSEKTQLPILSYIITNNGQGIERVKKCLDSIFKQDYPSKIAIVVNTKDGGDKEDILGILGNVQKEPDAPLPKPNEVYKGTYQNGNLALISFNDYLSITEARGYGIGAVYGYTHIFSFIESNEYFTDDGLSSLAISKFIINPNILGLIYCDKIQDRFGVEEHQVNEINSSYFITKACLEQCNKVLPELSNNYNVGPMLKSHLPILGIKSESKIRPTHRSRETSAAN